VTLSHASALEEVDDVLALRQEEAIGRAADGDAEEVMQIAKVRHSKLRHESSHDGLKKCRRRSSHNDVVDVEQQVSDTGALFVNKEGGVGGGGSEAELPDEEANRWYHTRVPA
jgi:hypothetical protein